MVLNPILVSAWTAAWAVLCATLPIHLILHGMIAMRIGRTEGWNAILRRGRYFRAMRQEAAVSRAMLFWVALTLAEVMCLLGVSVITFATGQ
jgi:hypothetical protein